MPLVEAVHRREYVLWRSSVYEAGRRREGGRPKPLLHILFNRAYVGRRGCYYSRYLQQCTLVPTRFSTSALRRTVYWMLADREIM